MKKLVLATCLLSLCAAQASKAEWYEDMSMKGDFRYRHEYIDQDGKESRTRQRIRVRFGFYGDVNEEISYGVRLASGSSDPVSSNQTLTDAGSSKGINLDKAYLTYEPAQVEGLGLTFGKMGQPWMTASDLIWDGDFTPEGISAVYALESDMAELNLQAGGFWMAERSSDSRDAMLYTAQAAVELKASETLSLTVGGSLYAYDNLEGYAFLADAEDGFGNTGAGDDGLLYANEFNEVEGFAVATLDTAVPVKVYGNYVVNTEADENDTGYLVGVSVGSTKSKIPVELGYNYRSLEADAVVGALADSDFAGGGTNGEGHKLMAKVGLMKSTSLGVTYFINSIDPDGSDVDYNRLQIDLAAKF